MDVPENAHPTEPKTILAAQCDVCENIANYHITGPDERGQSVVVSRYCSNHIEEYLSPQNRPQSK